MDIQALNWAIRIQTTPLRSWYLNATSLSLTRAGFRGPHVRYMDTFGRGAFPAFWTALTEMIMWQPDCDRYMIVQDDVLFCKGVREYLETVAWPGNAAALSPYTSAQYEGLPRTGRSGFFGVDCTQRAFVGACCLIFNREGVIDFLTDRRNMLHRWGPRGRVGIDSTVGEWAARQHKYVCIHRPSLLQHVGDISAANPKATNDGYRRASGFPGEDVDAVKLMAKRLERAASG